MRLETRPLPVLVAVLVLSQPAAAEDAADLISDLSSKHVASVQISVNPWGGHLGSEVDLGGDDPGIRRLIRLVQDAEPGADHRCANVGSIRFRMADGTLIGVGLLPAHDDDGFGLRLYRREDSVGIVSVGRESLISVLEDLGLPRDSLWPRP